MFFTAIFLPLIIANAKFGVFIESAVTQESIKEITSEIWESDANRFNSKDLIIKPEGERLFEYVNENKLVGTYQLIMDLFDNYVATVGQKEVTNSSENAEEDAFLEAVLESQPMEIAHRWLVEQKLAREEKELFKQEMRQYWLQLYSRSKKVLDSSGFEHVFLGEIDKKSTAGFHNWLFAYLEEKKGNFNYKVLSKDCKNNILSFNFTWHGYRKPKSSMVIGASPEAELAIYTVCFLARADKTCKVRLSGMDYDVATFKMSGNKTVSTSYLKCQ